MIQVLHQVLSEEVGLLVSVSMNDNYQKLLRKETINDDFVEILQPCIEELSRALTGPPRRRARPVDQIRCSARDARARRHMSSIDDQSAAPGVSPTSADSPVRAGQRPVDLVLRAKSNRWQVHCEIIGNRSIF